MTVEVLAPAKVTLSLRITGVRDDGYHLIDAEMTTVDLCDHLTFSDGDGLEVIEAGCGLPVPDGDQNLVSRALALVRRQAMVRIVKVIPAGVGLGGGSADAAAVLRWAAYGLPSVKVCYHAEARIVGRVPPSVFLPRPRVESALVEIVRRPAPLVDVDPQVLFGLVRAGFGQRRKMLRRSLRNLIDEEGLIVAGVDPTARAEDLGLDDWAAVAAQHSAEGGGP